MDNGKIYYVMEKGQSELYKIWNSVLEVVEEEIDDRSIYTSFFVDSYIAYIEQKKMYVAVSTGLAANLIKMKYLDMLNQIVLRVTQTNYEVVVLPQKEIDEQKDKKFIKTDAEPELFFKNSKLNSDLTFDNFVVGFSNKEAYQASLVVSTNRGKMYNPLFIYGDSGIGKTHLLHSIGNFIKKNEPNVKVLIFNTDDFVDEYTKAARGESDFNKFKEYINSFDVLLVDDIQFLVGKKKTEEQFFVIFRLFHDSQRQIVITCDRLPNELDGLEQRLITRFNDGLPEKISKPEIDTCKTFLKNKIIKSGLDLNYFDEEAIEFLASKFSSSIRELQGAFNKLLSYTINFKPTDHIDLEITQEAVGDLLGVKDSKSEVSERKIINKVASYYNLVPSQLTGNSHSQKITLARHIAMYLIRDILDLPYKKIGQLFGGKDHSTVMSAINKVDKMLITNNDLKSVIKEIKDSLK